MRPTHTMIPAPTGVRLLWEEKWLFLSVLVLGLGCATFAMAAVWMPSEAASDEAVATDPSLQSAEVLKIEAQLRNTLDERLYLDLKRLQH